MNWNKWLSMTSKKILYKDVFEKLTNWNLTLLQTNKDKILIGLKTIVMFHKQKLIYISIKKSFILNNKQIKTILEEEFFKFCRQKTFLTWLILKNQCTTKKMKNRFKNLGIRLKRKLNLLGWQICLIPKKMIKWRTIFHF